MVAMNHLVMEIIDKMLINVTTNCFKVIDIKNSPQFNFFAKLTLVCFNQKFIIGFENCRQSFRCCCVALRDQKHLNKQPETRD